MAIPICILAFDRPGYFREVIGSIRKSMTFSGLEFAVHLFQDGRPKASWRSPCAPLPNAAASSGNGTSCSMPTVVRPRAASRSWVTGPMPQTSPKGRSRRRPYTSAPVELADAGRLVEAGSQLGQQLGGPDTDGAGDAVCVVHLLLDTVGDGARRAEQPPAAGDVQVRLVDGRHLHEVRVLPEQLDERAVDGEVRLHVDRQELGVRAQPLGLPDGQRAVHSVLARLVGAGRDHPPPPALAADDDRPAAQFGAARLLHRGEEGVHVEMEDRSA